MTVRGGQLKKGDVGMMQGLLKSNVRLKYMIPAVEHRKKLE